MNTLIIHTKNLKTNEEVLLEKEIRYNAIDTFSSFIKEKEEEAFTKDKKSFEDISITAINYSPSIQKNFLDDKNKEIYLTTYNFLLSEREIIINSKKLFDLPFALRKYLIQRK